MNLVSNPTLTLTFGSQLRQAIEYQSCSYGKLPPASGALDTLYIVLHVSALASYARTFGQHPCSFQHIHEPVYS